MFQRSDINEGMTVRSIDGEKLGKVFAIGDGEFHIEKGLFFPKDYLVRYSEVSGIRDGEIILNHGKETLRGLSDAEDRSTTAGLGGGAGVGLGADTSLRASDTSLTDRGLGTERTLTGRATEDVTIPVHREELDVTRRERQAGEVRVKKDVVEEEKVMEVPVRRERVRVERRDVTPGRPAMGASFQEETIVVPMRAEEVDVTKRAVVDEEVVIHKDAIEEERRVAETVRREDVDVRTEGDVEGPRTLNAPSDDPLKRG